jgi:[acyl-carrier-protein] S-malonyltransferase
MEPVAERLRPVLEEMRLADPAVPVFTNVDAAPVHDAGAARDALLRQVASPVLWHDQVKSMLVAGFDTLVEVGPGKVLSGLVRRIGKEARVLSVEDPAGVEQAIQQLKESV